MELKIFFIIFEEFFEWQKQNIAIITLKQVSITKDKQYIYYMKQGIIYGARCFD